VCFLVYKLRRFIGSSFDVYFHLWNNGVPRWEREKHLWEIEQEKEWIKYMSKSQKRKERLRNSGFQKKVYFAKKLVQDSPQPKHKPSLSIHFGDFDVQIQFYLSNISNLSFENSKGKSSDRSIPVAKVFKRLDEDLNQVLNFHRASELVPYIDDTLASRPQHQCRSNVEGFPESAGGFL